MGHDCNVIDQINSAIMSFVQDFGQTPECLLVGPDVALHLWDHVKDGILTEKHGSSVPEDITQLKDVFRFNGLVVKVVAIEGLCTFPLPYKAIPTFLRIINGAEFNNELN